MRWILLGVALAGCAFKYERAVSPGEVRGRLVVAGSGGDVSPAAGASVAFVGTPLVAHSGADGRFSFLGAPAGKLTLLARAGPAGAPTHALRLQLDLSPRGGRANGWDLGDVVLGATGGVTGTVTRDGATVAGARVVAQGYGVAVTDAAGHFRLGALPEGAHVVAAVVGGAGAHVAVTIEPGKDSTVALALAASTGSLTGSVQLPGQGDASGAQVTLAGADGVRLHDTSATAADGTFTASAPPGVYAVLVSKAGYLTTVVRDIAVFEGAALPAPIVLLAKGSGLTATAASGDGQSGPPGVALAVPLSVRVVDASGAPAGGRDVVFSLASGAGSFGAAWATTADDGTAKTTLTPASAGPLQAVATVSGAADVAFAETATMPQPPTVGLDPGIDGTLWLERAAIPMYINSGGADHIELRIDEQTVLEWAGPPTSFTVPPLTVAPGRHAVYAVGTGPGGTVNSATFTFDVGRFPYNPLALARLPFRLPPPGKTDGADGRWYPYAAHVQSDGTADLYWLKLPGGKPVGPFAGAHYGVDLGSPVADAHGRLWFWKAGAGGFDLYRGDTTGGAVDVIQAQALPGAMMVSDDAGAVVWEYRPATGPTRVVAAQPGKANPAPQVASSSGAAVYTGSTSLLVYAAGTSAPRLGTATVVTAGDLVAMGVACTPPSVTADGGFAAICNYTPGATGQPALGDFVVAAPGMAPRTVATNCSAYLAGPLDGAPLIAACGYNAASGQYTVEGLTTSAVDPTAAGTVLGGAFGGVPDLFSPGRGFAGWPSADGLAAESLAADGTQGHVALPGAGWRHAGGDSDHGLVFYADGMNDTFLVDAVHGRGVEVASALQLPPATWSEPGRQLYVTPAGLVTWGLGDAASTTLLAGALGTPQADEARDGAHVAVAYTTPGQAASWHVRTATLGGVAAAPSLDLTAPAAGAGFTLDGKALAAWEQQTPGANWTGVLHLLPLDGSTGTDVALSAAAMVPPSVTFAWAGLAGIAQTPSQLNPTAALAFSGARRLSLASALLLWASPDGRTMYFSGQPKPADASGVWQLDMATLAATLLDTNMTPSVQPGSYAAYYATSAGGLERWSAAGRQTLAATGLDAAHFYGDTLLGSSFSWLHATVNASGTGLDDTRDATYLLDFCGATGDGCDTGVDTAFGY